MIDPHHGLATLLFAILTFNNGVHWVSLSLFTYVAKSILLTHLPRPWVGNSTIVTVDSSWDIMDFVPTQPPSAPLHLQLFSQLGRETADLRVNTGLNRDSSALTLRMPTGLRMHARAQNIQIPAHSKVCSNKAFILTLFPL